MAFEDLKKTLRKNEISTSYHDSFGTPIKATEDFVILKHKKLGQLELSRYLMPNAKEVIQRWIAKNNDDSFLKPLYFTLRDLHTSIKYHEPSKNSHSIFFKQKKADKVPRFDKIILEAQESTRTRLNTVNASTRTMPRAYNYDRL